MNKKLFFGMFAAATMLFATSCSNDEMDGLKGNESVVSFTLEQPGIATRAYSDGLKATNLTYAVYETESGTKVDDGVINGAFSGKQASVTFTLEKDKAYDFIFWADAYGDAETSPYDFNADAKTLTVSYTNVVSNDENRDAFYAVRKGLTIPEGSVTETITLYRPFAQLNIGAIGNDVIGFTPAKSSVTVTNVGNVLNFVDGTVTGVTDVPVAFGVAEFPQNEDFPVKEVDNYYSMNYLLAGIDSEVTEVGFTLYNADESASNSRTFANIPIRRNYRTNIYGKIGNILSNSATFNITIDEQYKKPDSDANFSGIRIGNEYYSTLEEALTDAENEDVIELGAGTYILPNNKVPTATAGYPGYAQKKNLTFKGTGSPDCTIIKQIDSGAGEGEVDYSLDNSTITFENLTIETCNEQPNRYYPGFVRCNGTYKNCIINGVYTLYNSVLSKFENCTFNVTGDKYNLKTYGASAELNYCTFNCDGKAVLVYGNTTESTVTFNDCTFNDNGGIDGKAAIEIGKWGSAKYNVYINRCKVNGFDKNGTDTELWGNKDSMQADLLDVVIDGKDVL